MLSVYVIISIFVIFLVPSESWVLPQRLIMGKSMRMSMSIGMSTNIASFGLTPVLKEYAETFHDISDNRMRYEELLHMATKCPPIKKKFKVAENKVPGCLSTVYVHAERKSDGKIVYTADADAQMTKGLVTLLVEGLTDNFASDIEKVDPAFIDYAGIGSSLTAGRNNGFLNMLALMKRQAQTLDAMPLPPVRKAAKAKVKAEAKSTEASPKAATGCASGIPIIPTHPTGQGNQSSLSVHQSILTKLQTLQPSTLTVENVSAQHKNHAGNTATNNNSNNSSTVSRETNFNVHVVAECFVGKSLVERHKMVYALLQQELDNGLHALSIVAKTPSEANGSNEKLA